MNPRLLPQSVEDIGIILCPAHINTNAPVKYGPFLKNPVYGKHIYNNKVYTVAEWNEQGAAAVRASGQRIGGSVISYVVSVNPPEEEKPEPVKVAVPEPIKEPEPEPAPEPEPEKEEAAEPTPEPVDAAPDIKKIAVELIAGPLSEVIPRIEAATDPAVLEEALKQDKRVGAQEAIEARLVEIAG